MKIGIIDYGIGNLRSVEWAFEHLGARPVWVSSQSEFKGFERLVLPGVGAFSKGAEELKSRGLFDPIRDWLGHARLDTTNHYARANLETKRKALEQVDPTTKPGRPPRWRRDPELLSWLDSL